MDGDEFALEALDRDANVSTRQKRTHTHKAENKKNGCYETHTKEKDKGMSTVPEKKKYRKNNNNNTNKEKEGRRE